jgi:hypothetical protein
VKKYIKLLIFLTKISSFFTQVLTLFLGIEKLIEIKGLKMNRKESQDLITAGLTATIGAGIVTSFAVSQGQDPLLATVITLFSGLCAVIFYQADLI